MTQALARLASIARSKARQQLGTAGPAETRTRTSTRRTPLCVQATVLYARWQRCGQGRLALAGGCACLSSAPVQIEGLDGMILDHLHRRFAKRPRLSNRLEEALRQADQGQQGLSELLQALAYPECDLPARDLRALIEALEICIASIEEHAPTR